MQAEFITPQDAKWEHFLQHTRHDVYHLPAYLTLCGREEGAEPVAFLVEDGLTAMLMPMLLRRLPASLDPGGRWLDATAPYGYACPLVTGDPTPGQMAGFLAQFQTAARDRGVVSAFFRLHPLLPLPREPFLDFGNLVDHGDTVYLDLTLSREELDSQMRATYRNGVHKLQREGFQVVLDQWEHMDDFIRIYTQTMVRHTASSFYFFEKNYFQALRDGLGERLHLALVYAPDGTTITCAALFMEEDGFLEYHLSGTEESFLQDAPSKLMICHMRDWGKARGDTFLHLGGGVGAQADSLFLFKKGFSKLRSCFTSFRMVVNVDGYAQVSSWGRDSSDRKLLERRRYFPGYRRPASGDRA